MEWLMETFGWGLVPIFFFAVLIGDWWNRVFLGKEINY